VHVVEFEAVAIPALGDVGRYVVADAVVAAPVEPVADVGTAQLTSVAGVGIVQALSRAAEHRQHEVPVKPCEDQRAMMLSTWNGIAKATCATGADVRSDPT
jgi:hypothetical protein